MIRASLSVPLAALCLAGLASAAVADEYAVEPFTGGYLTPPELVSTENPNGATQIVGSKTDVAMVTVTLPFRFPFFGALRDKIRVSADGWIAFGTASIVEAENPALPVGTKREALVAALWDDLRTTGKGSIVTFTLGTSPNRRFVVAWRLMDTASRSGNDFSFETILHETTGRVEIVYEPVGNWRGLSFTAGIEDDSGKRAFGGPNLSNANEGRPAEDQRFIPNSVSVSGTITRNRPTASATGLGSTTEPGLPTLPVRGARVALTREDDGRTVATGLTNADGTFTVAALGIDGVPGLAVELLAAGEESRVTDATGATWTRRIAAGVVPAGTPSIGTVHLDAAVDVVDPNFRKALSVQQAARRGFEFALAASATATRSTKKFPELEIRWVQGSATASGYTAAAGTTPARATISDAPANPDPYDDDIVLREYGQHVLASIAALPTGGVLHQWTTVLSNESLAFLDGFSFWFAAAVEGRAQFIDTITPSPFATVFDLELPNPAVTGPAVTGAVAASLWELVDGANDAFDGFVGALPEQGHEVLVTLDQRKGADTLPAGSAAWTVSTFFDAWRTGGAAAEREATGRAFIRLGTLADDSSEPNDVAGEEKAFTAPTRKLTGLVLNRFNEDRFSFAVGSTPVSVAVSFPEEAIVEVSVLDAAGGVQVSATNAATESSVVVVTPGTLAPGTYVARIAWKSGPAAHYSLSIYDHLVLVTTALPEWTAGEPFNFDVVVTGGLAPLKLTLDPAIPGLSFGSSGTHLTGRPEVAAVQDVDVIVEDASGAEPRVAGTLHVVVNPALVLPEHFGVPAARTIAVDLGTGGTAPVWTTGGPTPAGFTFTGGDTLRLAGPTGSPRTFDVSGTGTDAVGASVIAKTCHVVVCEAANAAGRTAVTAGEPFGFYFDAIEGSRASFDFAFTGRGTLPQLVVLDVAGATVPAAAAIRPGGGHVRVVNLAVPLTGRYFLVFKPAGSSKFTGSVSPVRSRVRPPVRISGVADIATPTTRAELRFHAIAGSVARVVLRSGEAPVAAKPDFIELKDPNGQIVALPSGHKSANERRKTVSGIELLETGEYLLTVGGDDASTGPLLYTVEISPPNGAPFKVD